MAIQFNAVAVITSEWTSYKVTTSTKVLSLQYDDDGNVYTIWGLDGPVVYQCTIWKGTVPPGVISGGYSQATNDADKSDFETNYKVYFNQPIHEDEFDPRLAHRFGNLTSVATAEVLMASQAYAEPASQAQRSVVSTSANDTSAGSGAKAVRITYLDSNYILKTEDVTMNGTTAVNTTNTDIRFIEKFQVIQGAAAVGTIKIMSATAGGGSQVAAIGAATEDAYLCHHYVPAGKRAFIYGWGATIDNNANFKLKSQQRFSGNLVDQHVDLENMMRATATIPSAIMEFYRKFEAPFPVGEKCYIRVTVVPGQTASTVERSTLDFWEDKA